MRRRWFWLEDQPDTIKDFKAEVDREVSVTVLATPADLIRALLDLSMDERRRVGLILDVMLVGNPRLWCPKEWHGGGEAVQISTHLGNDAGLVLFESFMLPNSAVPNPPLPPPPVIFLTVVRANMNDFEERVERVREAWGRAHGVPSVEASVDWARKWDSNGKGLLAVLRRFEEA